jgi:hypothetical protein
MEHAVSLFFKEMAYQMCDGYSVNTGWFTSGVHIRGVFDSPDEQFDPKKHSILFEFHQGALLRKELELVTVDILGMADAGTVITQVIDAWTSSVNDVITPGRNLKIEGRKIKIAGANGANGVYFKKTDDTLYMQLDPRDVVTNNPSELIVVIPYNLTPGTYHVEVATQYSGSGNLLKEIRRTVFDKILTVNPPQ